MSPVIKQFLLLPLLALTLFLGACNTDQTSDLATTDKNSSTVGSFVWHDLISDDLGKSQAFYAALFGWQFVDTHRTDGRRYKLIRHHGRYIGGMLQLDDPDNGEEYSRWLGYLSVADIDTALNNNTSASGETLVPVKTIDAIGRAAAIKDPQGAVVGLISSDIQQQAPETTAGNIVWNELLTQDPKQSADFYQSLSGLSVDVIQRRGGNYYMLKAGEQARAGIVENPFEQSASTWLSYFSVDDVEQSTRQAQKLGAKILLPPSPEVREGTLALISDPTGALLVLEQDGTGAKQATIQ